MCKLILCANHLNLNLLQNVQAETQELQRFKHSVRTFQKCMQLLHFVFPVSHEPIDESNNANGNML